VPTLTVTGPTNPLSFNPPGDPFHQVLRDDTLFCISCELNVCPYKHECMENVGSETVIKKIQEILNREKNELLLETGSR
jgi:ADP-heptose:LPS heptosyltransferase